MTLESAAEIAGIVAIPVAIIGWFVAVNRKNIITGQRGGTAATGDIRSELGGVAVGHNSPVTFVVNSPTATNELPYDKRGGFKAALWIVLGSGHMGPISLGLYDAHTPRLLCDPNMDAPLEIPETMRTTGQRRLYWMEGDRFLDESLSYRDQGVHNGHTLILTDVEDPELVELIAKAAIEGSKAR